MAKSLGIEKRERDERKKLHEVIEGVNAAAEGITRENFAEGAQRILDVFDGCPFNVWQRYDDQCWREKGFWLARSVRNSPHWSEKLFKVLSS